MINKIIGISIFALFCTNADAQTHNTNESKYTKCEGNYYISSAFKIDWKEVPSKISDHKKLRSEQGVDFPNSPNRILLYENGGDLHTTYRSIILTRGKDGVWIRDVVSKDQIWMTGVNPTIFPHQKVIMNNEASSRIDNLLKDKCLFASPSIYIAKPLGVGGLAKTMEIEISKKSYRFMWLGMATKRIAELADLADGF